MKKLLDSDCLRAVQFKCNAVQKKCNNSVNYTSKFWSIWLANKQYALVRTNEMFCFQIKRVPWMAQFFSDCVICVRFFYLTISIFFILNY